MIDPQTLRDHLGARFAPGVVADLDLGTTGASNDTVLFSIRAHDGSEERYVLRAQTGGHRLFPDSDVLFQAGVLRAVAADSDVPVPAVVLEEPDPSHLGSPFFVMRHVPGRAVSSVGSWQTEGWLAEASAADRTRVWQSTVEMIARINRVDWRREALASLEWPGTGAPGLGRYLDFVAGWADWALRGRPHPTVALALDYVREQQPAEGSVELCWGDATLANLLYGEDLSVTAVLDWEMAALGPGEMDLGWLLFMTDMSSIGFGVPRLEGLLDRADTIALYARNRERPIGDDDVRYYEVLAALRMSLIIARFVDLQTATGSLPADNSLFTENPATAVLARHLGLDDVGSTAVSDLLASAANRPTQS